MSKKFIHIHGSAIRNYNEKSNRAFAKKDYSETFDEIIPVDCLIKVYKYLPCTTEHILIYVFVDPVTGYYKEIAEWFVNNSSLAKRLEYLGKMLIE